jgi:hypothetical protein
VGALGLRAKVKIDHGLQHGQTLFVVAIEAQESAIGVEQAEVVVGEERLFHSALVRLCEKEFETFRVGALRFLERVLRQVCLLQKPQILKPSLKQVLVGDKMRLVFVSE